MTSYEGRTRSARLSSVLRRLVFGMVLVVIAVGVAGLVAVRVSTGQVGTLTKGYTPANEAHLGSLTSMLNAETGIRGYALTGRRELLSPYTSNRDKIVPSITATKAALNSVGRHDLDDALDQETAAANAWLTDYAAPIAATAGGPNSASVSRQQYGTTLFNAYRTTNTRVSTQITAQRDSLRAESRRLRDLAYPSLAGAVAIAVLLALLLALRANGTISGPLSRLAETLRRVDRGDLSAHADEATGPTEVRSLARAVNELTARARADAVAERDAEMFRQRTRLISSTIRRTTNSALMSDHLARGLGSALEADRVWLHTFADERVPRITAQWQVDRLPALGPVDERRADAIHGLATRLWDSAQVLSIDDHRSHQPTEHGRYGFRIAQTLGATSSMVVPIGDSTSVFGLLWISMAGYPRHWTLTETGVAQHLAADLAHSLMQAHLIERQAEAVALLRELDQAKSDFISTVSHELRTPLTSITGYLELINDGDVGEIPPSAQQALQVVDRNATRLRNLIEDLLTQSRIDAGRLRLDLADVDLSEVLVGVQRAMTPLAASKDVLLELSAPPLNELLIKADAQQLEQVFTNLVSNAIKFTAGGGRVTVAAEADIDEDGVLIQISDDGIGIPDRDLPNLFNRFFRASNAFAAATPGTGLGLAIVQEIVGRHGGEVAVDTELNRGSTFSVWLPVNATDLSR